MIAKLTNVTLFVARVDHSPKANFELINSLVNEEKMPNCNIVLNGVNMSKRRQSYHYGHYGRYGHYGHYGHYGRTDGGDKTFTEK